jgi:hypothetical protein
MMGTYTCGPTMTEYCTADDFGTGDHHDSSAGTAHMGAAGTWMCGPTMDHYCVTAGVAGPEPSTASGHWTDES